MLPRVAAARVVAAVSTDGNSLTACLSGFNDRVAFKDRALLAEMAYGTLREYPALSQILDRLLDKPLKGKDSEVHALLLCGLYQLKHMRIPAHAVVNECVASCRPLRRAWARGLVNGVLREFTRTGAAIEKALAADPVYRFAHPPWLIQCLRQAWPEHWQKILEANNRQAPMTLRVNRQRTTRAAWLAGAESAAGDKSFREAIHSDVGLYLQRARPVSELPGFDDGQVSVQDEAAQLAAPLLDLRPGQRVLDACCAPGGKTGHLLETETTIDLLAIDNDARRMAKVQDNLDRLQLSAKTVVADVIRTGDWWDGRVFDRILLDAPCSATGVIRRHPDIKLLRRQDDIDKLAERQLAMLKALWPLLQAGGKLLYATCSVLPQENDEIMEKFLHLETSASRQAIALNAGIATRFGRQLFPAPEGHDGFYYALLQKQGAQSG